MWLLSPQLPGNEPPQVEGLAEGWDDGGDEWESFEQPKTSDGWNDNWGDDFSTLQVGTEGVPCKCYNAANLFPTGNMACSNQVPDLEQSKVN